MTEQELRQKVVDTAKGWIGWKEADGSHKWIIDIYNYHKPLPRRYTVKYTDAWCATFVSAVGIRCALSDIIFPECSCNEMITLYKAANRWMENDTYKPQIGDLIMYDWQDTGFGDNLGVPDHVGIVCQVSGNDLKIIEGNISNAVGYRTLKINAKNIRGYCLPDYAQKASPNDPNGANWSDPDGVEYRPTIRQWQHSALADGFSFPIYGADGIWGNECETVAKKAIVKKRLTYRYKYLTKIVQQVVGVKVDGLCGNETKAAIKAYQRKYGLKDDGAVGLKTWKKMLNV